MKNLSRIDQMLSRYTGQKEEETMYESLSKQRGKLIVQQIEIEKILEDISKQMADIEKTHSGEGLEKMLAIRDAAVEQSGKFRDMIESISTAIGGEAVFGDKPDGTSCIVKSEGSTKEKFERAKEDPMSSGWPDCARKDFNDSLRATIAVDSVTQMREAIERLKATVLPNGQIRVTNKFLSDMKSGYFGIHANIKIGDIVAEVQIHSKFIRKNESQDPLCTESFTHDIYEVVRKPGFEKSPDSKRIVELSNQSRMLCFTQVLETIPE